MILSRAEAGAAGGGVNWWAFALHSSPMYSRTAFFERHEPGRHRHVAHPAALGREDVGGAAGALGLQAPPPDTWRAPAGEREAGGRVGAGDRRQCRRQQQREQKTPRCIGVAPYTGAMAPSAGSQSRSRSCSIANNVAAARVDTPAFV